MRASNDRVQVSAGETYHALLYEQRQCIPGSRSIKLLDDKQVLTVARSPSSLFGPTIAVGLDMGLGRNHPVRKNTGGDILLTSIYYYMSPKVKYPIVFPRKQARAIDEDSIRFDSFPLPYTPYPLRSNEF
jgi:hypothetical protein